MSERPYGEASFHEASKASAAGAKIGPLLGVLMVDTDLRIVAVTGCTRSGHDRLVGSVLSATAVERLVSLWERALGGSSFVDVGPGSDAASVYEASFGPVVDGGAIVGAIAVVREVPVERRARDEPTHVADLISVTAAVDGRYLWVSPSALDVTGWRPEQLLARPAVDLLHPDDVEVVQREQQRVLAGAELGSAVCRFRRPDGAWMWVEWQVRGLGTAFAPEEMLLSTLRDVRTCIATQADLAAMKARFELTFAAAPIGMALVRADGRFLQVNPAMTTLLARADADLLATTFQTLTHPDDLASDEQLLEQTITGLRDGYRLEKRYLRPDGTVVWASLTVSAVREASREDFFIAQVEDITAHKNALLEMTRLATTDHLTGLPNRGLLMDRLRQALASAHRSDWSVGVLSLNLDRFKEVNDTLGHDAGDELLRQVGTRLRLLMRKTDTATRIGGDEFVIVCDRLGSVDELHRIADRVHAEISRDFVVFGHEITVTAAVGVSSGSDANAAQSMLREADHDMSRMKRHTEHRRGSRREIDTGSDGLDVLAFDQLAVHAELRDGIRRGELRVHYQPIVDLRTGEVSAHEALVRWQHPQRGLLPPAAFLDGTDRSRLGIVLGEQVLAQACTDAARWSDHSTVHVNITARHLAEPTLPGHVRRCLVSSGIAPERLVLEITETLILAASGPTLESARHLAAHGIGLSLDDFGTGYSTIAALHRFPIDSIKIDRSFTAQVEHDPVSAALVEGLIGLGTHMHLDVIAEGVESPGQGVWLADRGCHYAQGFHYGRPEPFAPAGC